LRKVVRLIESLYRLINEIQRQHSPELRSFATNEIKLTGCTDGNNMLQAMINHDLKKGQGTETVLNQMTGLTLVFFLGNSTLSTDSGHEYTWCPASNRIVVTSSSFTVTQIMKATSVWQTSRLKVMLGPNSNANGTLIMTNLNCATIKKSFMSSGDKTRFAARPKKTFFSRHGRIFSRQDHTSPVEKVESDDNGSEIDVIQSTGCDGT